MGIITKKLNFKIYSSKGVYCEQMIPTVTMCPLCNRVQTTLRPLMTTDIVGNMNKNLCYPNPCKNKGMCKLSVNKAFYTCFCSSEHTGKWNVCKSLRQFSLTKSFII